MGVVGWGLKVAVLVLLIKSGCPGFIWFYFFWFLLVFIYWFFLVFIGVPGTWSFFELYLKYIHSDQTSGGQDYVNEMGYFCVSRFDRNV